MQMANERILVTLEVLVKCVPKQPENKILHEPFYCLLFGKDAKCDRSPPIRLENYFGEHTLPQIMTRLQHGEKKEMGEYLVLAPLSCGSSPGPGAQSPPAGWKARLCEPGRTRHALPCCHIQESRPTAPPHKRQESSNLQGQNSRAKHKHYKANPSHHHKKGRDSCKSHSSVIDSGLD